MSIESRVSNWLRVMTSEGSSVVDWPHILCYSVNPPFSALGFTEADERMNAELFPKLLSASNDAPAAWRGGC